MDRSAMAKVFAILLSYTIRTGVKEMYRINPVQSDIIPSSELITLHSRLFMEMCTDLLLDKPLAEIEDKYHERIAFFQSITHKI